MLRSSSPPLSHRSPILHVEIEGGALHGSAENTPLSVAREFPDMMSASEGERGGHGKANVIREVARIFYHKSDPNADKGEGVKKSENFADVINGCSS